MEKSKQIAIYGFGGFGREVASIIKQINEKQHIWDIIGYFDDGVKVGTKNNYGEVLGNLESLNAWHKPIAVVFAIASPVIVRRLVSKISNPNVSFPNIIAPTVFYFDKESFSAGKGNVIGHHVRISCNVKMNDFNIINGMVSFGHDVQLGNFNMMQPETRLSGETSIGDGNFFGVRSLVLQGLKIGNDTRIGVGSVVMRHTKDGKTYFGNPAKIMRLD